MKDAKWAIIQSNQIKSKLRLFKTRLERPFRLATKWMINLTDLSNYYKNTNVKKCLILPKLNDTKLYKLTACDKTLHCINIYYTKDYFIE